MANRGQGVSHKPSDETTAQAQMRHDDFVDQLSWNSDPSFNQQNKGYNNPDQDSSFLQQAGGGVMNMAQGAAQGAANMAKGAATGAANLAHEAATAVKSTLGVNTDTTATTAATTTTTTNSPNKPNTRI